ncbi:hypothetical protein COCMIDRAFT_33240 [Bipolaris oryzae ATCC 44560]|uniref:RBR-type E3 ubiquitin transferase n=1 Tax=Bipolaris oryzae ATCC 44560 TaxID=930090 RepID=W6ZHC1_COCMI|nr:uncharacterized protein COCMIDRAFT_33240 [Bipolaris oryzae ATCC 44560]EUC49395.1 hypothetical protein COCMIDRAFT_33240 [Bipolaris oryzae ATCC 44560]
MGCKLSRAVRPPAKAEASIGSAPTSHKAEHADTPQECKESAPQLSRPFSYDDIAITSSATLPIVCQRRNSAPTTTMETTQEPTAAFSLFLAERCLMSIQLPDDQIDEPVVATVPSIPTPPQPSNTLEESTVQCITCCTALPNEKDKFFNPCKHCDSVYCGSCIRHLFIEACNNMTRMPPRCCGPIQLHHARPHLTGEEIAVFKAKHEEWLTPNPFYCPIPTCSVFIPERLLPEQIKTDRKRTDSEAGIPISKTFTCHACESSICADCRLTAHPSSACNVSEFGIDKETTRLLKSWGYKQCPKCRHGIKRMFGCRHMECRCGAHFCYSCMGHPDFCGEDCFDDEDYEHESDNESMSESSESPETSSAQGEQQDTEPRVAPPAEAVNLDRGTASYWARQALDFGEEPGQDFADRAWNCFHSFNPYKIDLEQALTTNSSDATLECVKCWRTIYPVIREPPRVSSMGQAQTISLGSRVNDTSTERLISREHGRGRRRYGEYKPPRNLFRNDNTTMGATICQPTAAPSPLSQSAPDNESPLTQYLNRHCESIVDIYGNIIFPAEPQQQQRRASMDDHDYHDIYTLPSNNDLKEKSPLFNTASPNSTTLTPDLRRNIAYDCSECNLLVCEFCKDVLIIARDMGVEKHKERIQRLEERRERRRVE